MVNTDTALINPIVDRDDIIYPDSDGQTELQISDANGISCFTFNEVSRRLQQKKQELQAIEQELQKVLDRNQKMAAKLRALGIEPDDLSE
jgi:hypothetical protein